MNAKDTNEMVVMLWCNNTFFDQLHKAMGLFETKVITLMLQALKPSSFRLWKKCVSERPPKHHKKYEDHQ